MKIAIISGSHRPKSASGKVARFLVAQLAAKNFQSYLLDLGQTPLPLWDEGFWAESRQPWNELWHLAAQEIKACDGLVIISPEWSGMATPAIKNFFLLCGSNVVAHKPAMIVTVSSGRGGSYPVAELRMSSYKNTRICYIPDHVIVREADGVLNGDTPASADDQIVRHRLGHVLDVLTIYAQAFKSIRANPLLTHPDYPFGM